MSDPTPNISTFDADFTAELSTAFDTVMASEAPATDPTPPPTDAAPAAATPEAAPEPTPATPAPSASAVNDDAIIEVMVNGQPQQMRLGDARRGFIAQATFTQRMQKVAEQERAAQAAIAEAEHAKTLAAQYEQRFYEILGNRDKLAAAYIAAQGGDGQGTAPAAAPAYAPIDPDAMRQQIAAQVQQDVITGLRTQHEWSTNHDAVTTFTQGLIAADPVLSKISGYEDLVYEAVAKMRPTNLEQAREYTRLHIEGVTQALSSGRTEAAKAAAVEKAKAVTGIERGGSPVVAAPKEYTSFEDPQMEADMLAFLSK